MALVGSRFSGTAASRRALMSSPRTRRAPPGGGAGPAPPAEELPLLGRGRPLESQSQDIKNITGDIIVDVADGEVSGSSM